MANLLQLSHPPCDPDPPPLALALPLAGGCILKGQAAARWTTTQARASVGRGRGGRNGVWRSRPPFTGKSARPVMATTHSSESFSVSTRLGILFIVHAAGMSVIAVSGLLLYVPTSRLSLVRISYPPSFQGTRTPPIANGVVHALILPRPPGGGLGAITI